MSFQGAEEVIAVDALELFASIRSFHATCLNGHATLAKLELSFSHLRFDFGDLLEAVASVSSAPTYQQ